MTENLGQSHKLIYEWLIAGLSQLQLAKKDRR